MEIEVGNIFDRTQAAWEDGKKVIIHKGGTGSGKTYDLMIFIIFYIALRMENAVITVVSESKPHLDIGAIRILKAVLKKAEMWRGDAFNISTSRYTFPNGSMIEFFSADRIDKALGARRDVLYGNEINSLKFEVWDELARRSEYVLGDFNPTHAFWLEKFLQYYDNNVVLVSNYKDNPFLPDIERQRIEKRASMDSNFKRIHIDCEYGSYEGLVFEAFTIIEQMPEDLPTIIGLDWGYSNDPTAMVEVALIGDNIYLDELLYRTGLTNADLAGILPSLGVRTRYTEIIADSAEPKSIEDLRRAGFNVRPASKGQDSIQYGIDIIRAHKVFITVRSVNLIKEMRNYSWVLDKTGQPTNKPIDSFNHAIDAVRYAVMAKRKKLEAWAV